MALSWARIRSNRVRAAAIGLGLVLCSPALTARASDAWLSLERNPIDVTREAIESAESDVRIVTYKFDEKGLRKALIDALERGVRVRLVADAEEARRRGSHADEIAKRGGEVRLWKPGKLHAKFTIVDASKVLTGSFNYTESAQHRNVELLLELDQPHEVKRLGELFEQVWDAAEPWDG
jgi:phosphatidylserine/phosphatidylglycerophosphate/cardiolipin synthase-like enzyme